MITHSIQVGGDLIDIPSEQRLRELEMELAKTKLCLVGLYTYTRCFLFNTFLIRFFLQHYRYNVTNQSQESEELYKPAMIKEL